MEALVQALFVRVCGADCAGWAETLGGCMTPFETHLRPSRPLFLESVLVRGESLGRSLKKLTLSPEP